MYHKIIGMHSLENGTFCRQCFEEAMNNYDQIFEWIDGVKVVWNKGKVVREETYTVSRYDTTNSNLVGDVFKVIRDDTENVDEQNEDWYPEGLVCRCGEVVVTRWEDDGAFVHFVNGDSEYRTVYKSGFIDGYYYVLGVNEKRIIVTDVISGTDDYYELDSIFEYYTLIYIDYLINANVFIAGRDSFYVSDSYTGKHMPVKQTQYGYWKYCYIVHGKK